MVENIRLKIIDSNEEILDIVNRNIGTLVNFDFHAGYPLHAEKVLNVDNYSSMIIDHYPTWLDRNWVTILASKGYMSQYLWFYPHNCNRDNIKMFESKNGKCLVYNIKFNRNASIDYRFIMMDADFFGCKVPVNWNLGNGQRKELFFDVIESLTANDITLVISKSENNVNYNVGDFLEDVKTDISKVINIKEV